MLTCILIWNAQSAFSALILTSLFSFDNYNSGLDPRPRLVLYTNGTFYGTASSGGAHGQGTVFKMTLEGSLTVLVAFNGTNGSEPYGGLMLANDGNFYGTTMHGGASNVGTIFRMTPEGALTVLASFMQTNGGSPSSGLSQSRDGNFYGTTDFGGVYGFGTAFRMTPAGSLTTLVSFDRTNSNPMGGLIEAADGNFYGTARLGGEFGVGSIFRLTASGDVSTMVSFSTNGYWPSAGLFQASDGNLYGTTAGGFSGSAGTVFRLSLDGVLTTLAAFHSIPNPGGAFPLASLMQASDGNLYGTTVSGGTNAQGTIFRVTPDGTFSTIYSFTGTNDGVNPRSELVQGDDGDLYGVTSEGGFVRAGNIFRLSLPMPPVWQGVYLHNGAVTLTWKGVAGQSYEVEYCTDLTSPGWLLLEEGLQATKGILSVTNTLTPDPRRFYRVGILP